MSSAGEVSTVGSFPKDWAVAPLGAFASFRTGPFGSALHKSDYTDDGVPVINPMHIIDGRLAPTSRMTVTEVAARDLSDFRLRANDVIIGRRGDMGRCAVVLPEQAGWLCGTGSMIVRCADGMHPAFLQRVLSSPRAVSAIEDASVGSTMTNLNQVVLSRLLVQVPSVSEQRVIAAALADADVLVVRLDHLIAKSRDLRQAVTQQLLEKRARLPGLTRPWISVRLGDVAEVRTGPFGSDLHERDYVADGTPIVTVEHLGEFGIRHENLPLVSAADRLRLANYALSAGDIVFSRVGSIDRNALIRETEEGWLFSGRLLRVRPNREQIIPSFLGFQFSGETFRKCVRGVAVGQTMASLNTRLLSDLRVDLPSLGEQTAIAEILSDMDAELAALEARREKTIAIKQGMMQELLTGRARLV